MWGLTSHTRCDIIGVTRAEGDVLSLGLLTQKVVGKTPFTNTIRLAALVNSDPIVREGRFVVGRARRYEKWHKRSKPKRM